VEYFDIIGVIKLRRMRWKRVASMKERRKYAQALPESFK
jgi:hypothetical protein